MELPFFTGRYPLPSGNLYRRAWKYIVKPLQAKPARWFILFGYAFLHNLGSLGGESDGSTLTLSWMGEWQLGKVLQEAYQDLGFDASSAWAMTNTVRLLISQQNWYNQAETQPLEKILTGWLTQEEIRAFTGINRYKDILWFNREAFEDFVWWMAILAVLEAAGKPETSASRFVETVLGVHEVSQLLLKAEKGSDYQVNKLISGTVDKTRPRRG